MSVIALQETPTEFFQLQNFNIYRNNLTNTNKAAAVAIRMDLPVQEIFHHSSGRIAMVRSNNIWFMSLYVHSGHQNRKERSNFLYNELAIVLQKINNCSVVIGSDNNSVLAQADSTSITNYSQA